jgi:uroporphyrinogen-III synthase
MIPVITVRPQPGADSTVTAGHDFGLDVQPFPMSRIVPLDWQAPPADTIDGLLLGSANAVRHGGAQLTLFLDKPAFVVGPATAAAARAAGFKVELVGQGGLQTLLASVPGRDLRLLRLAAHRHVDVQLPPRMMVETRIAYHAKDLPMPDGLAALLCAPAVVLLHSAGSAQHFAAEVDRLGLVRAHLHLASLGPRIADAAGQGWAASVWPERPAERDLLALAARMCH